MAGSDAAAANIRVGDLVLAVDGRDEVLAEGGLVADVIVAIASLVVASLLARFAVRSATSFPDTDLPRAEFRAQLLSFGACFSPMEFRSRAGGTPVEKCGFVRSSAADRPASWHYRAFPR